MAASTQSLHGDNNPLRYVVGHCSLGHVLVASSGRGVCAILLGDDVTSLERELQERFPMSELINDPAGQEQVLAEVVRFAETSASDPDVPIDAQGTDFQLSVWELLRDIPAGRTASYSDIARRLGRPKSVRAVARACAANPLALVIPCHRVVRKDGELAGYRWGTQRKRELLEREAGR